MYYAKIKFLTQINAFNFKLLSQLLLVKAPIFTNLQI